MTKIIVISLALLMPLLTWLYSPTMILNNIASCRITHVFIDASAKDTSVTTSDWAVTRHFNRDIGFFTGDLKVYSQENHLLLSRKIYRSFSTTTEMIGYQMHSTTVSVSKLKNDTLLPAQEHHYLPPLLHIGYVSLTSFFRLPDGTTLFGLPDRPRGICQR